MSFSLVWWVLPERLLGLLAVLLGRGPDWQAGRWSEPDDVAALALAHRVRGVFVLAVFLAAFLAGAVATWVRLDGSS